MGSFRRSLVEPSFLRAVHAAGVNHFDTAQLYNEGRSEAALGHSFEKRADVRIFTKIGVPYEGQKVYSRMGSVIGRYGKEVPRINARSQQLEEIFAPASFPAYLRESLVRLRRQSVAGLLIHSVPTGLKLDCWVDKMRKLKREGLVELVGLSVDEGEDLASIDCSWADILQIPLSYLSEVEKSNISASSRIQLNRTWAGSGRNLELVLNDVYDFPFDTTILVGTKKISRVKGAQAILGSAD